MNDWKIYIGDVTTSVAEDGSARFDRRSAPPPWRDYAVRRDQRVRETFRPSSEDVEMVNAAIHLRRPLLITGKPGCGKSSLAYSVAQELGLGKLLTWPINTKSTLQEGLRRVSTSLRQRSREFTEQHLPRADSAPRSRPAPQLAG